MLLKSIQNKLGFGSINKHSSPNALVLSATKFSDFIEAQALLIPFFVGTHKYKILGVKSQDYEEELAPKKVAQLMGNKAHLTIEGLDNIRLIKANMNRGRTEFENEG